MRFSKPGSNGEELFAVKLFRVHGNTYAIQQHLTDPSSSVGASDWLPLIIQAIEHAKHLGAREIMYRLVESGDWEAVASCGVWTIERVA